jgi:O-antigen ligase
MKKASLVFFVLLAIIPLIFLSKYDYGYHTPKVLVFWFVLIAFCIIKVISLLTKKISISLNYIGISLLVYAAILVLSSSLSQSPTLSFYSTFERMDGVIGFMIFVVFYFVFSQEKIEDNIWRKICIISTLVACLIAIIALVEYNKAAYVRAQATFANPLTLAYYLLFHFLLVFNHFISILISQNKNKYRDAVLAFFVLILLGLGIFSTASRGPILALAIGIFISAIYYFVKLKSARQTLGLIYGGLTAIGLIAFLKLISSQNVIARIADFSLEDNSAFTRLYLWKTVAVFWQDKPWLGWGKEHFVYFFAKHYQVAFHNSDEWYDRSHNFILDKFLESGILGLITYLIFFGISIWMLFRKTTNLTTFQKGLLLSILVSFFVFHFTIFESLTSNLILFTCLIFISQRSDAFSFTIPKFSKIAIYSSLIALFYFGYTFVYKTTQNYITWNKIKQQTDNFAFVDQYDALLENAEIGKYDMLIKYGLARTSFINDPGMATLKPAYYQNVEKQFNNQLNNVPNHPILLSQLGFLQFESGQTAEAIKTYELLKTVAPKRHTNILDLATMYTMDKQYDKALAIYDFVISYDNIYQITFLNKAYCLALMGKKADSRASLEKLSPKVINQNQEKYNAVKAILAK